MSGRVLVAMSGGVDSSVAALLLKERGFHVVGVSLDLFDYSDVTEGRAGTCCSLDDVYDAKRVCHRLGIPHYVFNFRDKFEESVIENFIGEYVSGRTPNPCVVCNEEIKFRHLLMRAKALGFDFIATGHYARIKKDGRVYRLYKGVDRKKDQSYFLYMLDQENLPKILFPCGGLTKERVREIATEAGLPVKDKEESQEICFVTEDSYRDFLRKRGVASLPGKIMSVTGEILGTHEGIHNFTIGQRRGLGISSNVPMYVVDFRPLENLVIVGPEECLYAEGVFVEKCSFVTGKPETLTFRATAKVRYRSPEHACTVEIAGDGWVVRFDEPVKSVTPGQILVLYDGDEVIGGGVISKAVKGKEVK